MSEEKKNWFKTLQDKINALSEQFGLDELQADTLRGFITRLSKDQYRAGNKSGAAWAFEQAKQRQAEHVVNA